MNCGKRPVRFYEESMVNGKIAVRDGVSQGVRAGKMIKRGKGGV